ncbi:MAG: hypothetical protein LQ338_003645 [Usnochroma carphineum]|nr:MAG: hypothetical protein LQ338_003645 [Usnochroma carphineum]
MSPERCIELLQKKLAQKQVSIPPLQDISSSAYRTLCDLFQQLAALPSFGNGREVETLAKNMLGFIYRQPAAAGEALTLSERDAVRLTKTMLHERQDRSANMPDSSIEILPRSTAAATADLFRPPWASGAPPPSAAKDQPTKTPVDDNDRDSDLFEQSADDDPTRDPDVSDAIWEQLQADKQAHEQRQQQEAAELRKREEDLVRAKAEEVERAAALERLNKQQAEDEEARRELEAARLAEQRAREAREKMLAALEEARVEQERGKREEERVQRRLREMGVCVMGYRWVRQQGGWRCEGGSHFVGECRVGRGS